MAIPVKLIQRIDAFLAVRKKSDGGFAPVTETEMEELDEIVGGLIAAKYEKDPDGDLPVRYKLLDRTRYDPDHYVPVASTVRAKDWQEYIEPLADAMTNVRIATDRADILMRCMREHRRQQLAGKGKGIV